MHYNSKLCASVGFHHGRFIESVTTSGAIFWESYARRTKHAVPAPACSLCGWVPACHEGATVVDPSYEADLTVGSAFSCSMLPDGWSGGAAAPLVLTPTCDTGSTVVRMRTTARHVPQCHIWVASQGALMEREGTDTSFKLVSSVASTSPACVGVIGASRALGWTNSSSCVTFSAEQGTDPSVLSVPSPRTIVEASPPCADARARARPHDRTHSRRVGVAACPRY